MLGQSKKEIGKHLIASHIFYIFPTYIYLRRVEGYAKQFRFPSKYKNVLLLYEKYNKNTKTKI